MSDKQKKPRLGLATTRELMEELSTRLQLQHCHTVPDFIPSMLTRAALEGGLNSLSADVLNYRTVDSD